MFYRNISSHMDYAVLYPRRWQHSIKWLFKKNSLYLVTSQKTCNSLVCPSNCKLSKGWNSVIVIIVYKTFTNVFIVTSLYFHCSTVTAANLDHQALFYLFNNGILNEYLV
jgi:hypothetical protein